MRENFDILAYLMGKQAGGEPPGPTPGGYGYTKLAEQDFTVITSSTTQTDVGTIACGSEAFTSDKMLYVRIRDKAGKRPGYFLGVDQLYVNINSANHTNGTIVPSTSLLGYDSNGTFKSTTTRNGVFSNQLSSDGKLTITAKYNSSYGAIDGTYHVEVYLLDWPDGVSPFATS
jgi:hypothetical protein